MYSYYTARAAGKFPLFFPIFYWSSSVPIIISEIEIANTNRAFIYRLEMWETDFDICDERSNQSDAVGRLSDVHRLRDKEQRATVPAKFPQPLPGLHYLHHVFCSIYPVFHQFLPTTKIWKDWLIEQYFYHRIYRKTKVLIITFAIGHSLFMLAFPFL